MRTIHLKVSVTVDDTVEGHVSEDDIKAYVLSAVSTEGGCYHPDSWQRDLAAGEGRVKVVRFRRQSVKQQTRKDAERFRLTYDNPDGPGAA